jgi:hypothetical protein
MKAVNLRFVSGRWRWLELVLCYWGYVVAASGAAMMVIWCYRFLIAPGTLPSLDEAMYYMSGAQIWRDVTQVQLYAFARDTYHQQIVPFMGSYLSASVMLVGGPSLEMARLASLLSGAVGLVMISLLSAAVAGQERGLAAGLTAGVWGSAPLNLLISSANLMDAHALLFASTALLAAVRFAQRPTKLAAIVLGSASALCFLTKYNVGGLLIVATLLGLGLFEIRGLLSRGQRHLLSLIGSPWILLAVFGLVPIVFWLSLGGLRSVAAYFRSHAFGPMTLSEQFLFYPRALFESFFTIPALGLLPLGGLCYWAIRGWSDVRARIPMLYVLLSVVGATFHNYKEARLLFVPMAVLVALGVAGLAQWLAGCGPLWRKVGHGAALLVCVVSVAAAPQMTRERFAGTPAGYGIERERQVRAALEFLRENVNPTRTVLFLGSSHGGLDSHVVQMWISQPQNGLFADVRGLPYPGFPDFKGWGFSTAASPRYEQILMSTLVAEPDTEFIVVRLSADCPFRGGFYPYMMAWQENYIDALDRVQEWKPAVQKTFSIGMQVSVYRRAQKE